MKLYVGNLSYSVNDSTLRALFEPFGNIESARVISDRDTGSSKGFGFVEMSDDDAQKAMGALNGRDNDGRALKVNEAKPQENRGGGGVRRRRRTPLLVLQDQFSRPAPEWSHFGAVFFRSARIVLPRRPRGAIAASFEPSLRASGLHGSG